MNLERFVAERQPNWEELDGLVRTARRRAERLGPERVRRLGALYRAAAADLAFARSRFPGDPVTRRLEDLVGRSRHLVYSAPGGGRGSVIRFFLRDYWRLVAERWIAIVAAIVLLFGPAALAGAWGMNDPPAAIGVVPSDFRPVAEEERPWEDMSPDEQAAFSSAVLTNNIRVTLLAFAGGITLGLLTALVLIYNGIILGAIAGLMIEAGNGTAFVNLVTGHGVLELSCIVVAGAAGLSFGWAIVEPGHGTRDGCPPSRSRAHGRDRPRDCSVARDCRRRGGFSRGARRSGARVGGRRRSWDSRLSTGAWCSCLDGGALLQPRPSLSAEIGRHARRCEAVRRRLDDLRIRPG